MTPPPHTHKEKEGGNNRTKKNPQQNMGGKTDRTTIFTRFY